jgi:hypothetical protein
MHPGNSQITEAFPWDKSLKAGLVGWRRSADRTRLHANSLLTGNFTGNFSIPGPKGQFLCEKLLCRSSFSHISLLNLTGKRFARTGNFLARTGKFAAKITG